MRLPILKATLSNGPEGGMPTFQYPTLPGKSWTVVSSPASITLNMKRTRPRSLLQFPLRLLLYILEEVQVLAHAEEAITADPVSVDTFTDRSLNLSVFFLCYRVESYAVPHSRKLDRVLERWTTLLRFIHLYGCPADHLISAWTSEWIDDFVRRPHAQSSLASPGPRRVVLGGSDFVPWVEREGVRVTRHPPHVGDPVFRGDRVLDEFLE